MRRAAAIFALLLGLNAYAQEFQRYDLSYRDLGRYNPAAVAEYDKEVGFLGKYRLPSEADASLTDNPLDFALDLYTGGDKGNFMIGGFHDGYSYYTRYKAYLGYAWKVTLGTGFLNMGACVNIALDQADMTKYDGWTGSRDDLTFITEDFDLGFEYRTGGLHAGIACRNILSSRSEWEEQVLFRNPRTFSVNVSYDLKTRGDEFQFSPFLLGLYSGEPALDAGAYICIVQEVELSYSFRIPDFRHIAAVGFPVPGTRFVLRGAYSWGPQAPFATATAGIAYKL